MAKLVRFSFPVLLIAACALCESQQTPTPYAPPAPAKFSACSDQADATGLTECERIVIQNLVMQAEPLLKALGPLNEKFRQVGSGIESSHPGMRYEQPSQQFPTGRLVKVEKPAEPPKK